MRKKRTEKGKEERGPGGTRGRRERRGVVSDEGKEGKKEEESDRIRRWEKGGKRVL